MQLLIKQTWRTYCWRRMPARKFGYVYGLKQEKMVSWRIQMRLYVILSAGRWWLNRATLQICTTHHTHWRIISSTTIFDWDNIVVINFRYHPSLVEWLGSALEMIVTDELRLLDGAGSRSAALNHQEESAEEAQASCAQLTPEKLFCFHSVSWATKWRSSTAKEGKKLCVEKIYELSLTCDWCSSPLHTPCTCSRFLATPTHGSPDRTPRWHARPNSAESKQR